MTYRNVASRDGLWEGETRAVVVDGTRVLLVCLEGCVHAYEDRCAHQRVALSGGRLAGPVLTCPAHGWTYDARTGDGLNPAGVRLRRLALRIDGDAIEVEVDRG